MFGINFTKSLFDVLKSLAYLINEKHTDFCRSVKMSNRIMCPDCISILILTINHLPLLYLSSPTCLCDQAHDWKLCSYVWRRQEQNTDFQISFKQVTFLALFLMKITLKILTKTNWEGWKLALHPPSSSFRTIQKPPRIGLWGLQAAKIEGQILRGAEQLQLRIWLLASSGFQQHLQLLQGSRLSGSLQLPTGICSAVMHFYT